MVYSIDATTAMQTRGLVYEVWVRLESSRHSFLGKRCSIGRAPIILNQLKSIEINVLRQHWSCTVQCTSLEEPFDRLVPAFDYGNFHSAICLPFCLKRTTSYIKFTKLIRIEFK